MFGLGHPPNDSTTVDDDGVPLAAITDSIFWWRKVGDFAGSALDDAPKDKLAAIKRGCSCSL